MPALRAKPPQKVVNVRKPAELRAWATYWNCSQRDIRDAVHTSGIMVVDVADWLKVNCSNVRIRRKDA